MNKEKRDNSKAYHSATHLLHESLRRTLGKHVAQKGSLVTPERLRFDFSHNKPIEKDDLIKIDKMVNNYVQSSSEVQTRIMTPKEATDLGALALFGEKYGEEVRVVFMGKENNNFFSIELCGGTHVKNTKDIGKFKVISQSSIASGISRVEALRGKLLEIYEQNIQQFNQTKSEEEDKLIETLKKELINLNISLPPNLSNLEKPDQIKELNKKLESEKIKKILSDKNKNIINDKKINNFIFRYQFLEGLPSKELRKLVDQGKKEIKEGVVLAISVSDDKIGLAVGVTNKLIEKYDAVKLVKQAAQVLGGSGGGGRKDFAQAGGVKKADISKVREIIESSLI